MGYIYTHTHTDREKPLQKRLNDFPKILRTESRVICITICGFPQCPTELGLEFRQFCSALKPYLTLDQTHISLIRKSTVDKLRNIS